MKDIFILTKVLYKNSLGQKSLGNSNKKSLFGKILLIVLVIGYLLGVLGYFSYEIINGLLKIHQEEVFISFSLLLICGFTLFRTIFTAISILYFSKDIEFLLPMPVAPIKIVFAKFNIMLISNYINELLLFGIPYIIYWYLVKLDVIFLFWSALVFLVIPMIPMLLSSVIIVLIMRCTSFLRNKDVVQYISVIITIAIVLGMQFLNSSSNQTTDFIMANKLVEINGYSSVITKYFFTIKQGTEALVNTSFKNLAFLYLESIGAYVLVIFFISKIYLKSALKVASSGIKTRRMNLAEVHKSRVGKTYVEKEMKQLFRTPMYLFQCVLPSFLFPIVFSIPVYRELSASNNILADLSLLKSVLLDLLDNGFGMGIILIGINFLYMFNFISVTSISREGENAIFMKYIPIPYSKQYKYKAIPGIIVNLIPLSYVLILLKLVLPELDIILFLEIIILAILSNILVNYFAVFIDIINPKLHWSSEYAVVKQNINMLYSFVISLLVIAIILGAASYIESTHVLTIVLSSIMIAILGCFEIFLRKYENIVFKKIA